MNNMTINIKKSASYAGQAVKFKKIGSGMSKFLIAATSPGGATYDTDVVVFQQFSLLSSSSGHKVALYGGFSSGVVPYGYIWDPGSSAWSTRFDPPATDSGEGRFTGVGAATNDGKFMLAGGIVGFFTSTTNNSNIYDPGSNSWTSTVDVTGFTNGPAYEFPIPATATNFRTGEIFIFGGSDLPPGPEVWRDQLVVWNGSAWNTANNSTIVPPKPASGAHYLSMAAKDTGSSTELMLFTGSYGFGPSYQQTLYYWTQNSTSPVSGTWSYVTGSTGSSESMPTSAVCLMWEDNRNRWTAMSLDPAQTPNIWVSSNDGVTWTSYTYSVGSWSNVDIDLVEVSNGKIFAVADPARNQFYISNVPESAAPGDKQELWKLVVDSSPASSTLTKLYP